MKGHKQTMDKNEIKSKLVDMLAVLFSDNGVDKDVLEYADLIDDLGMDSITFISIIVEIEDAFEIIVPDDMLLMENFRNLDLIIQIIEDAKNATSSNEDKQEDVL